MKLIKEVNLDPKAKMFVSVGDEIFYYPPHNMPAFHNQIEHVPAFSHQLKVIKVSTKTFDAQDGAGNVYRVFIKFDRFQVVKRA